MISKQLLEILVCPDNHTRLEMAESGLVDRLNQQISLKKLRTRGGALVETRLDGGLVREDQTLLYPIMDGIPILLLDEAIPLEQLDDGEG